MRGRAALVTLVAALTAAGCARVTEGTGSGVGLSRSGEARFPSQAPTTSASTSESSSAPTSQSPPAPTNSTPTASSPSAQAVPPPRLCGSGRCKAVGSAPLDHGYQVTIYSAPSPGGGVAATVTELSLDRVPVYWHVTDDASASQVACSPAPQPNCGLAVFVGAHASEALGLLRVGNGFQPYARADSNTPTTKIADLNGDGWIDVAAIQNTYQPSYAAGQVYWQTSTSNGRHFASTGCSVPSREPSAAPTAPLTGSCPSD
jgi:hypothetical protein